MRRGNKTQRFEVQQTTTLGGAAVSAPQSTLEQPEACMSGTAFDFADPGANNGEQAATNKTEASTVQIPPIPDRVLQMVPSHEGLLIQGWRAETAGLGIGAFAYYRRVVEKIKDPLFDEILSVAHRMNVGSQISDELEKSKANFDFHLPMDDFTGLIPISLLIKNHNPFALLHKAMSEGYNSDSDEDCLELAGHIRVLLTELTGKIAAALAALQADAEINQAINRLA